MMYLTYQLAQIPCDDLAQDAARRNLARQMAAAAKNEPARPPAAGRPGARRS